MDDTTQFALAVVIIPIILALGVGLLAGLYIAQPQIDDAKRLKRNFDLNDWARRRGWKPPTPKSDFAVHVFQIMRMRRREHDGLAGPNTFSEMLKIYQERPNLSLAEHERSHVWFDSEVRCRKGNCSGVVRIRNNSVTGSDAIEALGSFPGKCGVCGTGYRLFVNTELQEESDS